jgi:hypothetical protein
VSRRSSALAERSADFRLERSRAQLGLDEVRAALPDDGALVSFVRHNRTVFSDSTKSPVANQRSQSASRVVPSYVALVTRKGQPSVAISIGPAQTIDSLVSRWRADRRRGRRRTHSNGGRAVDSVITSIRSGVEKARVGSGDASPRQRNPRLYRSWRHVEPRSVRGIALLDSVRI